VRNIIALAFITLDGVMQAPGGPQEDTDGGFKQGGWVVPYFDERLGQIMAEQLRQPFALLLGRRTFEIFASYWPRHEDEWPGVNAATKYVVSHKPRELSWQHSVLITGNVADELRKLKVQDGPNMQVHGSTQLLQTLLKHDLVDELWLKIRPVTLGSGKRLFGEGTMPAAFALTESEMTPSGVIVARYTHAGEVRTGLIGV
jgi:dihydrofolate reductase